MLWEALFTLRLKMKVKIGELKIQNFEKFHKFAQKFILKQFLAYPLWARKFYWKTDFKRSELKEAIRNKKKAVVVATFEEKIIGFAIVSFDRGGGANCPWLGVDVNFRNRGIGTSLVEEIEKLARQHKCHFMYLHTENENNIGFYQKRGYYLVGLQKESWCGINEYLMQKNLGKPFSQQWR